MGDQYHLFLGSMRHSDDPTLLPLRYLRGHFSRILLDLPHESHFSFVWRGSKRTGMKIFVSWC